MINRLLFVLISIAVVMPSWAQLSIGGTPLVYDKRTKTYMLTVPEDVFGASYHNTVVPDAGVTNVTIDGKAVTNEVDFPVIDGNVNYNISFRKSGSLVKSTLHFTYLPIMILTGSFSDQYVNLPVQLIFPGTGEVLDYKARIKHAGASTNTQWVHKNNLHVKFVDDEGEKMDVSFFGLRNDNHWRLDAGTRDMIRFRNYVASGLWADFGTKSYYADLQPNARSYIRGSHVEVFVNGNYNGFYNFSEFLDRKQLKLKKYTEQEIVPDDGDAQSSVELHGMLWKANDDTEQTLFAQFNDTCDNTLDEWKGFALVYPDIDDVCPTDYSLIRNAVKFVSESDDETFLNEAADYFDLPVMADYMVFLNVVFGIDNVCNNMVFACYDTAKDKKLTFAAWDLDATVGQHYTDIDGYYHADVIQADRELDSVPTEMCLITLSRLFNRVRALPGFHDTVVRRYWELRQTILHPDSLVARYAAVYHRLEACGALAREEVRWSDTGDIAHRMLDFSDEFDYLCGWLRKRIPFLDNNTFATVTGDVNGDGLVDVADVAMLISYVLGNDVALCTGSVDLNADEVIDVADITLLIQRILND